MQWFCHCRVEVQVYVCVPNGSGTPDGKAVENTVRIWGPKATFVTLSLGDLMLG